MLMQNGTVSVNGSAYVLSDVFIRDNNVIVIAIYKFVQHRSAVALEVLPLAM